MPFAERHSPIKVSNFARKKFALKCLVKSTLGCRRRKSSKNNWKWQKNPIWRLGGVHGNDHFISSCKCFDMNVCCCCCSNPCCCCNFCCCCCRSLNYRGNFVVVGFTAVVVVDIVFGCCIHWKFLKILNLHFFWKISVVAFFADMLFC